MSLLRCKRRKRVLCMALLCVVLFGVLLALAYRMVMIGRGLEELYGPSGMLEKERVRSFKDWKLSHPEWTDPSIAPLPND